jgi:hypothetical protein
MGLPRTFVGFSSSDINWYRLMCAWKANEHIDFNFTDCQLTNSINSDNEAYIKRVCRERINMAGTFVQLIGDDTRSKHRYVRWELEVALEKNCTIIGANIDGSRYVNEKTPPLMRNIGAVFVPCKPKILAYALEDWTMRKDGDWHYNPEVYERLGY